MASAPRPIERDAVERIYRLSPLQAGMLYHQLEAPGVSPYHRQVRFEIVGAVDAAACEAAWNGLLERHALLRSVFDWERTAQPLQIVLKQQRIAFAAHDGNAATVAAWCAVDAARGFDLRCDPLMRVALFRLGPDRFEMVWSHPHILIDGWSGAVLMHEFAALYAGAPLLPPAPDPDSFMAEAAARDTAAALDHWRGLLAGYDLLATLPRRAHGTAPPRMIEHRLRIDETATAAMRALARRRGTTLGVLLQAIWGLVLARWTGRDDIVFGIAASGRDLATPGIERLVGMFVATRPVRVRIETGDTIAGLLKRLQQQADAASAHDHVGLAAIQRGSALPDGLLDHLLVLENFPADGSAADSGFTVTAAHAVERANYDFGILVDEGATIDIAFQFDAARIDAALIGRVAGHCHTLITALVSAPDTPLAALEVMPASERSALATTARGPTIARDGEATLASLWQVQVGLTPAAPALTDGHSAYSYRALDRTAGGVAARLRTAGIGAGDVVGVLCDRSAARIVALLGIVKAGAAYLPLDPALPDARIATMLADTGCRRLLADAAWLRRAEALAPGLTAPIAGDDDAAGTGASAVAPGDPAYIIYTSGSTGHPKGVAVPHRGFVNMILAQIAGFGVRPDDSVVQFASCSFDASLSEVFMALLAGARLVIAPDAAIRDGAALLALLAAERITVATLPPSYLRALDGAALGPVRVLITAGEPPDTADMRRLARTLTAFNAYGPTEASVCASWHRIDPDADYADGIPIGRAIANTAMSVRDGRGRVMPTGATGEIWLSGSGLALGYLHQAELTAERFPTIDGERFYRTGDAGVLRADDDILYAGRLDDQVKLGGHRIELGEIETRLRAMSGIAQAAAAIAGERLLAFVVPHGPVDCDALRRRLGETLPAWMVPSAIVPLPALPTTIAGKVDRAALAATRPAAPATRALTPAEARVAKAFAAVLGGGPYGPDSGFAACGGDSLRAIRLLGQLRRDGFGVAMPALRGADTIAAIARLALETDTPAAPVVGPVPLAPIQHWYFTADPDGNGLLAHQLLLDLPGADAGAGAGADRLRAAVASVWQRHDALRQRFAHGRAGWSAAILPADTPLAWRSIDLREAADGWSQLAADADAHRPGSAASGDALFVATHYRLRDGEHLLLAAHHLLVDAVSWRILLEDIADSAVGAPSRASASYRDWAIALASPATLAAAEHERPYWQAFADAPARPWPVAEHGYDTTEIVTLDLGPLPQHMSERTVLAQVLARLGTALAESEGCAATDIALTSHGRRLPGQAIDASRTVGWFTADYPFRLVCGATAAAIEDALAQVPALGVGCSVLRWLARDPIALPDPAIAVNYLGDTDPAIAAFAINDRLPGVVTHGLRRTRTLEIEAWRRDGQLSASFRHAPAHVSTAQVQRLAALMCTDPISRVPVAEGLRERVLLLSEGPRT